MSAYLACMEPWALLSAPHKPDRVIHTSNPRVCEEGQEGQEFRVKLAMLVHAFQSKHLGLWEAVICEFKGSLV